MNAMQEALLKAGLVTEEKVAEESKYEDHDEYDFYYGSDDEENGFKKDKTDLSEYRIQENRSLEGCKMVFSRERRAMLSGMISRSSGSFVMRDKFENMFGAGFFYDIYGRNIDADLVDFKKKYIRRKPDSTIEITDAYAFVRDLNVLIDNCLKEFVKYRVNFNAVKVIHEFVIKTEEQKLNEEKQHVRDAMLRKNYKDAMHDFYDNTEYVVKADMFNDAQVVFYRGRYGDGVRACINLKDTKIDKYRLETTLKVIGRVRGKLMLQFEVDMQLRNRYNDAIRIGKDKIELEVKARIKEAIIRAYEKYDDGYSLKFLFLYDDGINTSDCEILFEEEVYE